MDKKFDIFKILNIDTKEDIYTFCLHEFLEASRELRMKSASIWGFSDNEDYEVVRKAIKINSDESDVRSKIVPDLILLNENHIAVIESKMFSSEGCYQTKDYEKAKSSIKKDLNKECVPDENINYYFFTLAGITASSTVFKTVRWADYYKNTLENIHFEKNINELEMLRDAIYKRAKGYLEYLDNWQINKYEKYACNENSWITPYSIIQNGDKDDIWELDPNKYGIKNGVVHGEGHSTYRTDIWKKKEYDICNKTLIENLHVGNKLEDDLLSKDNISIFSRIEWGKNNIDIIMNVEYWQVKDGKWEGYIPYSKQPEKIQVKSYENRMKIWKYLEKKTITDNGYRFPSKKKNSLHMCIKTIKNIDSKTMKQVIDDIKEILKELEEYEDYIASNLIIGEDGLLTFNYD